MNEDCDLFRHALIQQQKAEDAEKVCDKKLLSLDDQYAIWRELKGARHILKHFYAITAAYVPQWKKTGIPVSAMLVWEILRHKIKHRISRMERREIQLSQWQGYSLCNNFRARVAKEVMEHRKDWAGIFETRKVDENDNGI